MESLQQTLRIWKCCGLSPFELNTISIGLKQSKIYEYYNYFIIFLELIGLVFSFFYIDTYVDWELPIIAAYVDFVTLITVQLLAIIIHIESIQKRNKQIKIFQQLKEIDRILSKILDISRDNQSLRRNLIFDYTFWAIEYIIMSVVIITYSIHFDDVKYLHYWLFYMIPFAISNIRYMQFVAFIRLITIRFRVIRRCFKRIRNSEHSESNEIPLLTLKKFNAVGIIFEKNLLHCELILLRNCYHLLWETTILINKCFDWSLPFAIANDFCLFVINFYWIFLWTTAADGSNFGTLIVTFVWIIVNLRHFLIVTNICSGTLREVIYCCCISDEITRC